jgi:hypothetical protein
VSVESPEHQLRLRGLRAEGNGLDAYIGIAPADEVGELRVRFDRDHTRTELQKRLRIAAMVGSDVEDQVARRDELPEKVAAAPSPFEFLPIEKSVIGVAYRAVEPERAKDVLQPSCDQFFGRDAYDLALWQVPS